MPSVELVVGSLLYVLYASISVWNLHHLRDIPILPGRFRATLILITTLLLVITIAREAMEIVDLMNETNLNSESAPSGPLLAEIALDGATLVFSYAIIIWRTFTEFTHLVRFLLRIFTIFTLVPTCVVFTVRVLLAIWAGGRSSDVFLPALQSLVPLLIINAISTSLLCHEIWSRWDGNTQESSRKIPCLDLIIVGLGLVISMLWTALLVLCIRSDIKKSPFLLRVVVLLSALWSTLMMSPFARNPSGLERPATPAQLPTSQRSTEQAREDSRPDVLSGSLALQETPETTTLFSLSGQESKSDLFYPPSYHTRNSSFYSPSPTVVAVPSQIYPSTWDRERDSTSTRSYLPSYHTRPSLPASPASPGRVFRPPLPLPPVPPVPPLPSIRPLPQPIPSCPT
ncbi:hypothetical protein VKT23_017172 [Stygiomarasmius scandens]|uniref:Uncharacterized protein n=1 Tax=Marasmiellus scandens TaxID=2682957 RepID=A0ABR1IVV9_9AGAR